MSRETIEHYVTLGALTATAATGFFIFSSPYNQTDSGNVNLAIFGSTILSGIALVYKLFNHIDKKNEKRDKESKLTTL